MPLADRFRVVSWNIRAGGGVRAEKIAAALARLTPDIIVLSEYRSTPPSQFVARAIYNAGLNHQRDTVDEVRPGQNALLIASRYPMRKVHLRAGPEQPGRWLMMRLTSGLSIGGMHIPNQHTGRKAPFHDALVDLARRWRGGPALFAGDTNSGCIHLDEERPVFTRRTHNWFESMSAAGWKDGFRQLYPQRREFTWYSHRGNGFRLDQAFLNRALSGGLLDVRHSWLKDPDRPQRRDGLSDHAALIVDLDPEAKISC